MATQEFLEFVTSVTSITVNEHEIIQWSDGSVTIEHWMYQCEPDNPAYDHQYLSPEQAAALCSILQ